MINLWTSEALSLSCSSASATNELGAFVDTALADYGEEDQDSASDAGARFIISDLSDILISDIFMASIDWLGTYLLDLLGTLDFLSLVYFLSTFLVSTWLGTFLV